MNNKYILYNILLFMFSVVSTILILTDTNRPLSYDLLWLLPLTFSFCIVLVLTFKKSKNIFENLAALAIVGLFFLRNVITPVVMRFGNYASYFFVTDASKAILLMSYEMLMCFIVLIIATKKHNKNNENSDFNPISFRQTNFLFKVAFYLIVLFMVAVLVLIPDTSKMYVSLINYGGTLQTETVDTLSAKYGGRPILTLFTLIADFMRILIPTYLFLKIQKNIKNTNLALFMCLLIASLQFFFVGETSALAIFCFLVNLFVLYKIFVSKRKFILLLTTIGGGFGVVLLFFLKLEGDVLYTGTFMETISKMLQAYLTGVSNVSVAFNMPSSERFSCLFYDLYYAIPFNGTLFGLSGQTSANIFNSSNFGKFQIIACISQSNYYFGFILAPVISMIFTYFGVRVYDENNQEQNIWIYTTKTLLWIYLVLSIVMYNGQIFMVRLTNTIIPCLLISYLTKGILSKGGRYEIDKQSEFERNPA